MTVEVTATPEDIASIQVIGTFSYKVGRIQISAERYTAGISECTSGPLKVTCFVQPDAANRFTHACGVGVFADELEVHVRKTFHHLDNH